MKIDERIRAMLPSSSPWQQLEDEVKRLNARIEELEKKLKSVKRSRGIDTPAYRVDLATARTDAHRVPHHELPSDSHQRADGFPDECMSHMDALYGVACRLTRNPTEAEDLVQDALVKAMRARTSSTPART